MINSVLLLSAILLVVNSQVTQSVNANNRFTTSARAGNSVVNGAITNLTLPYPDIAAATTQRSAIITIDAMNIFPTSSRIDFDGNITLSSNNFSVTIASAASSVAYLAYRYMFFVDTYVPDGINFLTAYVRVSPASPVTLTSSTVASH